MILAEIIILTIICLVIYFIRSYCIEEQSLTAKGLRKYKLIGLINMINSIIALITFITFLIITAVIYE